LAVLVASSHRCLQRIALQRQTPGDRGGDDRRVVINSDDAIDGPLARECLEEVGRSLGMLEVECDQAGWIRRLERVRLL